MATAEDAKNALSPARQKQEMVVNTFKSMNLMLKEVLPKIITPERMARVCLTNFRLNPKLFECSKESIVGAVLQSAQLGLEPLLGLAYLIPYGSQCQFQLGYKGMIELFYRSPLAQTITYGEVRERDSFYFKAVSKKGIEWEHSIDYKLSEKERGRIIGYYCEALLTNGGQGWCYMEYSDIMIFAKKKSKSYNNGPWQTDEKAMCIKTVIKPALKSLPKSIELQQALEADETVKKYTPETENMFEVAPEPIIIEDEPKVGKGGEIIEPKVDEGKKAPLKGKVSEKKPEVATQTEQEKEAEEVGKLI